MQIAFDDGTLLLRDAPDDLPYTEWDDRVDEYRAQAYRYRALLEWTGAWNHDRDTDNGSDRVGDCNDDQATVQRQLDESSIEIQDSARAYPDLALEPALRIEPRDYQQAALNSWRDHDRRGSVVLPTGGGVCYKSEIPASSTDSYSCTKPKKRR